MLVEGICPGIGHALDLLLLLMLLSGSMASLTVDGQLGAVRQS